MSDYLKQKAAGRNLLEERLRKEEEFKKGMKQLGNAPIEKVDDFQKPMVKDLAREKINKLGEAVPVKNAAIAQAEAEAKRQAIAELAGKPALPEKVYDAAAMRREFAEMAKKSRAADALKRGGKKMMAALPFAGTAYGLMSGDPAMAAEEAAGDIPVLGQAYEAIKPTDSGNVEEERQMIAERNARAAYANSPAGQAAAARRAALMKMGR